MVVMPMVVPEGPDPIVYVPVPASRLGEVYEVLGSPAGLVAAEELEAVGEGEVEPAPQVAWTVEELRRFAGTPNTTANVVGKVLDVLAAGPGVPVSTTELEARTGVKRANIKGSLAAFTRHLKKHYPGHGWPMLFEWGPDMARDHPGQTFSAEGYYSVDEATAELWKQARAS